MTVHIISELVSWPLTKANPQYFWQRRKDTLSTVTPTHLSSSAQTARINRLLYATFCALQDGNWHFGPLPIKISGIPAAICSPVTVKFVSKCPMETTVLEVKSKLVTISQKSIINWIIGKTMTCFSVFPCKNTPWLFWRPEIEREDKHTWSICT